MSKLVQLATVVRFGKAIADFEERRFSRDRIAAQELVGAAIALRNAGGLEAFSPEIDAGLDRALRYLALVDGASERDRYDLQRARDAFVAELAELMVATYVPDDETPAESSNDASALVVEAAS